MKFIFRQTCSCLMITSFQFNAKKLKYFNRTIKCKSARGCFWKWKISKFKSVIIGIIQVKITRKPHATIMGALQTSYLTCVTSGTGIIFFSFLLELKSIADFLILTCNCSIRISSIFLFFFFELFMQNGWLPKNVKPYFQSGPLL